jgi:hypothetical protein
MSRTPDKDKDKVYAAEVLAFHGTPLEDRQQESTIVHDYRTMLDAPWWEWGHVTVRPARADMVTIAGYADVFAITTSAGRVHRYTVSHELAHLVVKRQGICDRHGPAFRTAHLYTVGAAYGRQYADLLAQAYEDYRLPVLSTVDELHIPHTPTINIDALSIAAAPRGGWRRK